MFNLYSPLLRGTDMWPENIYTFEFRSNVIYEFEFMQGDSRCFYRFVKEGSERFKRITDNVQRLNDNKKELIETVK